MRGAGKIECGVHIRHAPVHVRAAVMPRCRLVECTGFEGFSQRCCQYCLFASSIHPPPGHVFRGIFSRESTPGHRARSGRMVSETQSARWSQPTKWPGPSGMGCTYHGKSKDSSTVESRSRPVIGQSDNRTIGQPGNCLRGRIVRVLGSLQYSSLCSIEANEINGRTREVLTRPLKHPTQQLTPAHADEQS